MGLAKDREPLLPVISEETIDKDVTSSRADFCFKAYVIVVMTCLWTGYTLLVRYTRSTVPKDQMYSATTVVLVAEVIKLLITLFMILRESKFSFSKFSTCVNKYYFSAPKEVLKMSVPSIAYALQNNLDFIGLSNLDAGVYQVTTQLKVVTTAIFMMLFLGRKFSTTRVLIFQHFAPH